MPQTLGIGDGRMDIIAGELVSSFQTLQLHQKIETDNRATKLTNEMDRRFCRSSGRQEVVDNQHMLADFDRIAVHGEAVMSVFKAILHFITISRKFSRLANGDKSGSETRRENPAEDKPSGLNPYNLGDPSILIPSRQLIGQALHRDRIFQERGDVIKENAGLRKVRHFSNECLIVDGRHEN